jgi:hypothetical protein
MDSQILNLKRKVSFYKEVIQNTRTYRQQWKDQLKESIIGSLKELLEQVELEADIEERSDMENLEAIVLSLGTVKSGMYAKISEDIKRHLIKHNGSLIYQQLFNGKIIVLINYPFIENYGKPRPPKTIAIYRPEELQPAFCVRHLEEFMQEITGWEDYDDDEPNQRIGFKLNFPTDSEDGGLPQ